MMPAFTARRRAEEFNSLVEHASTEQLRDARYADLLEVVGTLRAAPAPEPRAEFVADLRSRLMVAAETALAPDTAAQAARRQPVAKRTKRERRIAVAVGGFAIVSATGSMAVAAQSSLPGDTLYPLKRAIENAHVSVQAGSEGKGSTMLDNASGRLDEVDELSRSGSESADDISATLDDFSAQADEASDLLLGDYRENGRVASLQELRTFAADSMNQLSGLEDVVPPEARDSLVSAAQTLSRIDERAIEACPACTSGPLMQTPTVLTAAPADPTVVYTSTPSRTTEPTTPARDPKKPGSGQSRPDQGQPSVTPEQPSGTPTSTPPGLPTGDDGDTSKPNTDNPVGEVIGGLTGQGGDTTTSAGGKGGKGGKTVKHLGHGIKHVLDDPTDALDDLGDGLK